MDLVTALKCATGEEKGGAMVYSKEIILGL